MKVLLVNTSERTGGAAVACHRLLDALNKQGIEATMLVRDKQTDNPHIIALPKPFYMKLCFLWERFVIWRTNRFSRKNLFTVSIANAGIDITRTKAFKEADIIHLHWVNQGMLSLKGIRKILLSGKPVVWTMHDMWPCTAICHHAQGCNRYQTVCQACPYLRFPSQNDLSHRVFNQKKNVYAQGNLHMVAVSRWLTTLAKQSNLLKGKEVTTINNALSLNDFQLIDKKEARKQLQLPDKHLIAFGAARIDDPIKGFDYLLEAIQTLIHRGDFEQDELHLLLFGGIKDAKRLAEVPVSYTYFGHIEEKEQLSALYSAADVTVSASLYETFGQTLAEAQACGCPAVSFGNSGQTDIITHKVDGYLAKAYNTNDLANGIAWALREGKATISPTHLRQSVVQRFSSEVIANKYAQLYEQLITPSHE